MRLAELLPQVNPDLYPDQQRLAWESWYFGASKMTWVWLVYLLSVVLLVMVVTVVAKLPSTSSSESGVLS